MSKIQLRPTAIVDLSLSYARHMGENKVRHYRVSAMNLMIGKNVGRSTQDIVREFIKKTEGETDVEFVEIPKPKEQHSDNLTLRIKSQTDVLKNDKDIRKALEKKAIKSQLHQYKTYENTLDRYKDLVVYYYNHFTGDYLFPEPSKTLSAVRKFFRFFGFRPNNSYQFKYKHNIVPCTYLSVMFEEGEYEEAKKALLADLRVLQNHRLILGHLSMPSSIDLADTVGLGRNPTALFCFLFLDYEKLHEVLGTTPMTIPMLPLKPLGVKYESAEGSINYLNDVPFNKKYEIEVVEVTDFGMEEARQAHIDSFEASKEVVNDVASVMSEALKHYHEVEAKNKKDSAN